MLLNQLCINQCHGGTLPIFAATVAGKIIWGREGVTYTIY